jgi:HPt (histidine-containing phosphotransfer) domain-containing protein
MDEKERLLAILAEANIDGLDPASGVARFGGNPTLYFKIIKTFVANMGAHLDKLRDFAASESTLGDYGIEVHGVKGSCYGIDANREGDQAKTLELAAKAGDYAQVTAGNEPFIHTMEILVGKLREVLDKADGTAGGGEKKAAPDPALLRAMLDASQNFDVDAMQTAIKELEKYEYETGEDLVTWLADRVTAFAYDEIQEKLEKVL